MNLWQTGLLTLGAAAIGWFACDQVKAGQMRADRVALETSLQTRLQEYNAASIAAQRREAERVIAAVQDAAKLRADTVDNVQTVIREIQSAPITTACVDSPAILVALDGLRKLAGLTPTSGDSAGAAAVVIPLPGSATNPER